MDTLNTLPRCLGLSDTPMQMPCKEYRADNLSSYSYYSRSLQFQVCRPRYNGAQWSPRRATRRQPLSFGASMYASIGVHPGTEPGIHGPAVFEDVPHLINYLPDLPTYPSPLSDNPAYTTGRHYFVGSDDVVARNVVTSLQSPGEGSYFRRSGPREKVFFDIHLDHSS